MKKKKTRIRETGNAAGRKGLCWDNGQKKPLCQTRGGGAGYRKRRLHCQKEAPGEVYAVRATKVESERT